MLSTKTISSAGGVTDYFFAQDNYYTTDKSEIGEAIDRSEWSGKGAALLGLVGQIEPVQFQKLLEGRMPESPSSSSHERIGIEKNGQWQHRAGFDLTFSAPKSLSMLMLQTDDQALKETLISIMNEATEKTLAAIERDCATARIKEDGKIVYEKTKNLVVGKFLHDISREGDPQVHHHSVVMNITKRADGKWRSLGSSSHRYGERVAGVAGFIESVRSNKKYYGLRHRSELAAGLVRAGIEIESTQNGFFEIKGISKESRQAFSTRSEQINDYINDKGLSGAKAKAAAALGTRLSKGKVKREELADHWAMKNAKAMGKPFEEINQVTHAWQTSPRTHGKESFDQANDVYRTIQQERSSPELGQDRMRSQASLTLNEQLAEQGVRDAITELSTFRDEFSSIALSNTALGATMGKGVLMDDILSAIDRLSQSGELIRLPHKTDKPMPPSYMSLAALKQEKHLVDNAQYKLGANAQVVTNQLRMVFRRDGRKTSSLDAHLSAGVLLGKEGVRLIDGVTLDNRDDVLNALLKTAKGLKLEPMLLTQTRRGKEILKTDVAIKNSSLPQFVKGLFGQTKHDTVARFLAVNRDGLENKMIGHKTLVMIDNAHRLSVRDLSRLTELSASRGARLVLLGNSQSKQGVRGTGFAQLIKAGSTTTHMRVLTERAGIKAMSIADRFNQRVGQSVIEVKHEQDRLVNMADHYLSLDRPSQVKTVIIMPSKAMADKINAAIAQRRGLGADQLTVLRPVAIQSQAVKQVKSYATGQYLRVNDDYKRVGLVKGKYYRVEKVYLRRNSLKIVDNKGVSQLVNPAIFGENRGGKLEVYAPKNLTLSQGERLSVKRTTRDKSLYKGQSLVFQRMQEHHAVLSDDKGKTVKLDTRQLAHTHLDYGYAHSVYSDDVTRKADLLMTYMGANMRSSDQARAFDALERATRAVVYTDDGAGLMIGIAERSGQKPSAIDAYINHHGEVMTGAGQGYKAMLNRVVEQAITEKGVGTPTQTPEKIASDAVTYAIEHLSERTAAFSNVDVLSVALRHSLGETSPNEIETMVAMAEAKGELIGGVAHYQGQWTTQTALQREREVLHLFLKEQGQLSPLLDSQTLKTQLDHSNPFASHRPILEKWLTSQNRINLLEGYAGVGKSTLLIQANLVLQNQGYQLLTLAPTHAAVNELKDKHLSAQTLSKFLATHERDKQLGNTGSQRLGDLKQVIVLDENSLTSTTQSHAFLKAAAELDARVLLMGDSRQLSAVEAGDDHRLLQTLGVNTLSLTEIHRQTQDWHKEAVKSVYDKDYQGMMDKLGERVIETPLTKNQQAVIAHDKGVKISLLNDNIAKAAAQNYTTLTERAQLETLLISAGHDLRHRINHNIRDHFKETGQLVGNIATITHLEQQHLTKTELNRASNYELGDILKFGTSHRDSGIAADSYLTVEKIGKNNHLQLRDEVGQVHLWSANSRGVQVYKARDLEVMQGDRLSWTQTDIKREQYSQAMMEVVGIEDNKLELQAVSINKDGIAKAPTSISVDMNDKHHQHIDYSYTKTTRMSQGAQASKPIIAIPSSHPHLTTQKQALVMITRGVDGVTVITDNKTKLIETLQNQTGEKTTAMEVSGRIDNARNYVREQQIAVVDRDLTSDKTLPSGDSDQGQSSKKWQDAKTTPTPTKALDKERLVGLLNDNLERIAEGYLGEPNPKSNAKELRFGATKGSFAITRTGQYRGRWMDYKTGENGDLLSLIAKHEGLSLKSDFSKVLDRAVEVLGMDKESLATQGRQPSLGEKARAKRQAKIAQAQAQKLEQSKATAQSIWQQTTALKGTLAEKYLTTHRGITSTDKLAIRYFEVGKEWIKFDDKGNQTTQINKVPALAVSVKNAKGEMTGVQLVYLDKKTGAKNTFMGTPKLSRGAIKAASGIIQQGQKNGRIIIAEGIETAASFAQIDPKATILTSLGINNLGKLGDVVSKQSPRQVIIAADNDGINAITRETTHKAVQTLKAQGLNVTAIYPKAIDGLKQTDWNDTLKKQGAASIKYQVGKQLEQAKTVSGLIREDKAQGKLSQATDPQKKSIINNQRNGQQQLQRAADIMSKQQDKKVAVPTPVHSVAPSKTQKVPISNNKSTQQRQHEERGL